MPSIQIVPFGFCLKYNTRESKVLQYFGNMRQNLAASHAFVVVMKVMNHIWLWDVELAWYSLSATQRICLYSLEHDFSIHSFSMGNFNNTLIWVVRKNKQHGKMFKYVHIRSAKELLKHIPFPTLFAFKFVLMPLVKFPSSYGEHCRADCVL